jgi:HPt (histidine-containing phosphotransfer) domain-containing protein
MLAFVGGDRELLGQVAAAFLMERPRLVEQLEQALSAGDARRAQFAGHTLKGSVRCFAEETCDALAHAVESAAAAGDLPAARAAFKALETPLEQLSARLERFLAAPLAPR